MSLAKKKSTRKLWQLPYTRPGKFRFSSIGLFIKFVFRLNSFPTAETSHENTFVIDTRRTLEGKREREKDHLFATVW